MTNALSCPACGVGSPLSRVVLDAEPTCGLYRCNDCLGVIAGHDAVVAAKRHFAATHPLMVLRNTVHRCRSCKDRVKPRATQCESCSASLLLACPLCTKRMQVVSVIGLEIDICRRCEIAFFDRGEFAHIGFNPEALRRALQAGIVTTSVQSDNGFVSAVFSGIDVVDVAVYGSSKVANAVGESVLEGTGHVLDAMGAPVEVVRVIGEGALEASEVAGVVAEVVVELLGSIFGP